MPDKNIAFVTFVQSGSANEFFDRVTQEGLVFKGKKVKIGWGKPTPLPTSVQTAVQQHSASRNVYIGSTDDQINEERLHNDFGEYGEIELINLIPDKNIAFVNFTDILSAIRAVEAMKVNPDYHRYKINYGKDRCGNAPRSSKSNIALSATPESPIEGSAVDTMTESFEGSLKSVSDDPEDANHPAGNFSGHYGWGLSRSANVSPVGKQVSVSQPSTPNQTNGRVSSASTPGIGGNYSNAFNTNTGTYVKSAYPGTPPSVSAGSFADMGVEMKRSNSTSPTALNRQLSYLNLNTSSGGLAGNPIGKSLRANEALDVKPSW